MLNRILNPLDKILNLITMYRLALYYLIAVWLVAFVLSFLGLLPFDSLDLLFSTSLILVASWITNKIFAKTFEAITNIESVYITAIILSLIITPSMQIQNVIFAILASVIAMSSKYILALNKKHFFNPAAIAVFLPSLLLFGSASWWIGSHLMFLPVVIGGFLLTRKLQRFDLVLSFLFFTTSEILLVTFFRGFNIYSTFQRIYLDTPILFFAFVMLTEPLTTPSERRLRIIYGSLVGIIFSPQFHLGTFYSTPEIALLIGNIYSYLFSFKRKLMLTLDKKIKIAPSVYDFVFKYDKKINFKPGQYLEWTLNVKNPDSRGNRRYFTIASSPTEDNLRIGVKFYQNSSKFKKKLLDLKVGDKVLSGELNGDFVLPLDKKNNLVFLAGGIGITPFRSMLKYLLDNNIKLPITIFYSNKDIEDIVYKDILDQAFNKLNVKTIYNLTNVENISKEWKGYRGRINQEIVKKEVKEINNTKFYLSGPHAMVVGFEETLYSMGIARSNIKKDFFPGF